jgi:hypothetical protein
MVVGSPDISGLSGMVAPMRTAAPFAVHATAATKVVLAPCSTTVVVAPSGGFGGSLTFRTVKLFQT